MLASIGSATATINTTGVVPAHADGAANFTFLNSPGGITGKTADVVLDGNCHSTDIPANTTQMNLAAGGTDRKLPIGNSTCGSPTTYKAGTYNVVATGGSSVLSYSVLL